MMQFTMNKRQQQLNNIQPPHINQYTNIKQAVRPQVPINNQQPHPQNKPEVKSMKWGESIWFLFHTLACKVKQEDFAQIRVELLNNIYAICSNLPCPACATHATEYMNKINYNKVQTKEDLKMLLFTFHNEVNKRKSFPIFSYSDLDEKYSKANTVNIIQNFMQHFQDKHKSIRMIANDFHRTRLVSVLKVWFNKNIQHFDT